MHHPDYQNNKPLNMDTKIHHHESKGSFCIDALLSRNDERATSPELTRSTSSTSTRSRSPPISPGCEEVSTTAFVPRPGLLNQTNYINSNTLYSYQGPPQGSAFHSLDGGLMQKVHIPVNPHSQFHQIQMEWLARTGMFYPRLQDLTVDKNRGKNTSLVSSKPFNSTGTWEEMLIKFVEDRPALYNLQLPVAERTNLKKNALWLEIKNLLHGDMTIEEVKAKWKYLKDCYLRAKKKVNKYIPSGSAAQGMPESGFRYFTLMKFLDDANEPKQTVNSLTLVSPTSECGDSLLDAECLSQVLSPTSNNVTPSTSKKRRKVETNEVDRKILETLSTPVPKNDGVDGFLIRLGESLRRFPHRERAMLEIDIMKMVLDRDCN